MLCHVGQKKRIVIFYGSQTGTAEEYAIRLAKEIGEKEPKGIHLLVNNAGIARDDETKFCKSIH